jgi:hypothetical protein
MEAQTNTMKTVFTIADRGGRSYWTRIGVAFINKDNSITFKLDAVPMNGQLQLRDYQEPAPRGFDRDRRPPSDFADTRPRRDFGPDPLDPMPRAE